MIGHTDEQQPDGSDTDCDRLVPLADPGGGGAPGARPPLTAADQWFFYAQNAKFS